MWSVFPKFALLKVVFTAFSGLFLAVLIMFLPSTSGSTLVWGTLTQAVGFTVPVLICLLVIVLVLGKWGWKLLWKIPVVGEYLHKSQCPDLNGTWDGVIESTHIENGQKVSKPVTLTIKADFFGFDIQLDSNDDYMSSKVIQCNIYKDPKNGSFSLLYIFEAEVHKPREGDAKFFEGAAQLKINVNTYQDTSLKGTYWTNRMWQENKQTAGEISASRAK